MARKSADRAVRDQYAAYPYPARDPRDERTRLITGSPSRLAEIEHYVFGGRLPRGRPLRVLVAGGGTGDATVMLAQQAADAGEAVEITHLEPSDAARAIAEARVRARGLAGVRFVAGSLLDLPRSGLGPFDYVDCCGVLHHLDDPAAGLAALAAAMAPDGGMGLMVYGALGRTGVYPVQEILHAVAGDGPAAERVAAARALLKALPPTNWLRRNPFVVDHLNGGDAGLFDLLLHARDRAYRVAEVAELVDGAGLAVAAFIDPAAYDPASYVADPALAARFAALGRVERWAAAESLAGSLRKHVFYVVARGREGAAVARPAPDMAPVWREPADAEAARGVQPGQALAATLNGVRLRFAMPPLVAAIVARIDGRRSLAAIHDALRVANPGLDEAAFARQFAEFYAGFNGLGFVLLRRPST